MLKVYGSGMCPDCIECKYNLDRNNVEYPWYPWLDSRIYYFVKSLFNEVIAKYPLSPWILGLVHQYA